MDNSEQAAMPDKASLLRLQRFLRRFQSALVNAPAYKWFLLGALFLVGAINYADRTAYTALLPVLRSDLGMSDSGLAAIGSFFLWSYALVVPLVGYLGDRFSRRTIVVCSLAGWSLVTAMTGLASTGSQLLSMRVLLGITQGFYVPTALALLAGHHSSRTRATAMSIHFAGLQIGMVVGGTLAGYLGDVQGWRSCFLVLGGAGVVLAVFCWFAVYENLRTVSAGHPGQAAPVQRSFAASIREMNPVRLTFT